MHKMALKLNEEQLFHLLDLYESHDCLWNVSSANYKNRVAREEAFIDILNNLEIANLNIHDLKNKVKSLRSTYNQELSKIHKSKENGNYIYKPLLVWFDRVDSFLRKSAEIRKQVLKMRYGKETEEKLTILVSESESSDAQKQITTKKDLSEKYSFVKLEQSGDEDFGLEQDDSEDEEEAPTVRKLKTLHPQKRFKKDSSLQNIETSLGDIKERLYDKLERPQCEFELFGRHIGAQLKNMPLTSALNLQMQIQQLVANERIRLEQNTSSISFLN